MHYSPAAIHNSTKHRCDGRIHYNNGDQEQFTAIAWDSWTSQGERGLSLINRIEAKVILDDGISVDADAYTSSGSGYSEFAMIKKKGDFIITRIVSHHDDVDVGTM